METRTDSVQADRRRDANAHRAAEEIRLTRDRRPSPADRAARDLDRRVPSEFERLLWHTKDAAKPAPAPTGANPAGLKMGTVPVEPSGGVEPSAFEALDHADVAMAPELVELLRKLKVSRKTEGPRQDCGGTGAWASPQSPILRGPEPERSVLSTAANIVHRLEQGAFLRDAHGTVCFRIEPTDGPIAGSSLEIQSVAPGTIDIVVADHAGGPVDVRRFDGLVTELRRQGLRATVRRR